MDKEKNRFNVEEHTTLDGRIIDVFPISHRYIHNLEQEVKKQKEAINKIQMIITDMQLELIGIKPYHSFVVDGNIIRNMTKNIEDIIKEVSE